MFQEHNDLPWQGGSPGLAQQTMSLASEDLSEEERSIFQPFTRESLAAIEQRIAVEHAKQKELEKKRAEGEVSLVACIPSCFVVCKAHKFCYIMSYTRKPCGEPIGYATIVQDPGVFSWLKNNTQQSLRQRSQESFHCFWN